MARRRMIDPEFWSDEELGFLDSDTNLLYIGMWNFADDYGCVKASNIWLKAKIFPYRDVVVQKCLSKLENLNKIIKFSADNRDYYLIKNFLKIQKVEKPSKTRNPIPPDNILLPDYSPTTPRLVGDEVKLSKEKIIINTNVLIDDTSSKEKTPVKEKYGNDEVNRILADFKNVFGRIPIDKKPRFVANNVRLIINSFIKQHKDSFMALRGVELDSDYVYQRFYANLKTSDYWDKIEKLETVKQKLKVYLDLVSSDLTIEYASLQQAEGGNYAENTN